MPRHLISDAHEWINEIPTVPIYYLAKPQPRERAWQNQRGKKTLLSFILAGVGSRAWPVWAPAAVKRIKLSGLARFGAPRRASPGSDRLAGADVGSCRFFVSSPRFSRLLVPLCNL